MSSNKKDIENFPWVFWIRIFKREWYKKFSKNRGGNYLEIQVFKYCISIGMPWKKHVLEKAERNFPLSGLMHYRETNESFTEWYHFKIGKYKIN